MKPAILLLFTALANYAQTPQPPRYGVSSVKPISGVPPIDSASSPMARSRLKESLSKRLMMTAWNVQDFRIVGGGPDWVASRRWDVQAKPERAAASIDEIHQMLRTMLADRFQLHARAELRNVALYEMIVDGRGSKVPRPKKTLTRSRPWRALAVFSGRREPRPQRFAGQLSYSLARPVIDKTGLAGEFDFALNWTPQPEDRPADEPAAPADGPDIFTSIREQLGLRLMPGRGLVDVIVIDRAELPTPN